MEMRTTAIALALPAAATMRLTGAAGVKIEAREGRLWLTEEGCPDDVFLAPGESYRVRSPGRVVIEAERDSVLAMGPVRSTAAAPEPARAAYRSLRAALAPAGARPGSDDRYQMPPSAVLAWAR